MSMWESVSYRRLSPCERLWLGVLDQACADHGSPSARVRAEAAEWWAGDMPAVFSRALDIPLSRLARLRDARGGLRCAADGGGAGRKLGVKVPMGHAYDYDIRRVHLSGMPSRRMTG